MRTLPKKFRAWDDSRDIMLVNHTFMSIGETGLYNWENLKWMQYIGTHDKNGTDIYEGDILLWNHNHWILSFNTHNIQHFLETTNSYIKDDEKKVWGEWVWLHARLRQHTEVVGNIYENPELVVEQDYSYSRFDKPEIEV